MITASWWIVWHSGFCWSQWAARAKVWEFCEVFERLSDLAQLPYSIISFSLLYYIHNVNNFWKRYYIEIYNLSFQSAILHIMISCRVGYCDSDSHSVYIDVRLTLPKPVEIWLNYGWYPIYAYANQLNK